jgi:hypothetical protein
MGAFPFFEGYLGALHEKGGTRMPHARFFPIGLGESKKTHKESTSESDEDQTLYKNPKVHAHLSLSLLM